MKFVKEEMKNKLSGVILLFTVMLLPSSMMAQVTYDRSEQSYIRTQSERVYAPTGNNTSATGGIIQPSGYQPSSIGNNWFASVHLGIGSFIGSPTGCNDFFGRSKVNYGVSAGKWLSPFIGLRAAFGGNKFKDARNLNRDYYNFHGDILWNVTNYMRPDLTVMPRWDIIPFVGFGEMRNQSLKYNSFALTPGIIIRHRITDRLYFKLESSISFTKGLFDGVGTDASLADKMFNASVGFTYNIGGNTWKRKQPTKEATVFPEQDETVLPLPGHNNYDGLNRLNARLHPDGMAAGNNSDFDSKDSTIATVIFYFRINSTEFASKGQLINLRNLARDAMSNGYMIRVLAASDSKTGTKKYNRTLAIKRGKKMRKLLMKYGVPKSRIRLFQRGGIDLYHPYPLNRQAILTLYMNKL